MDRKHKKSVEVKLELGHRAVMRDKVTQEGFTHDWTVFVRGAEGHNIHFFVEKVVFHLHESFPKPKRVVKEPPYSVSESGYAGFIMPIDVYFRSREEPKKVNFKYDLYLKLESSPVSNIRIEKLTFQNPSDDFRNKLIKAGGLAGALTGSAAGGSASLSTQACAPPQHIEDFPVTHPKPVVAEKKPRPHVPCKEIKTSQPPPPKQPSQPFTDIFGAPIRTKNSPDSSSTKSKDTGTSSQSKSKNTPNSSSTIPIKEGKSNSKEFHKSKDNHHSNKERHSTKEIHQSSKDGHPIKASPHPSSKEPERDPHQLKDSHPSKESHISKEVYHKTKDHHPKEGHKKETHHSSKEVKSSKDLLSSDSKGAKSSKSIKSDKETSKSAIKRAAPTDSHGSHGNVEKKKKLSPVSTENSDKSSSQSKNKAKEGKEKTEKQKTKPLGNSFKKEEEKSKHKSSPAPPPEPAEPKEMSKPKSSSPKPPSPPPIILRPPSPPPKSPSPMSGSLYSGSDDESSKSLYKAHYSSPASSISESSLHSNIPQLSDHSIISPLSDDSNDDFLPPPKRKISIDHDLDDASPEPKPVESKPPKLNKKQHALPKPSKHKSENFHRGNGSINNDIPMNHNMPNPELQDISNLNNTAYREELFRLQRAIMSLSDRKLVQNIVDLIEKTGKYEITTTTFDFDLCSLDYAIIQQIKHYLDRL